MSKGKYRRGVFIVVFSGKKPEYLLLNRILHWQGWEFPKGGVDGENDEKAVIRELKEETGLVARRILDLKVNGKFDYRRELPDRLGIKGQTFKLYAVEVRKGKIKIDKKEHVGYRWAKFQEAEKMLTWNVQKRCLKVVNWFIKSL
jgi:8-oxo-dGTP pyrophosphatase MutT (NUDIX family)